MRKKTLLGIGCGLAAALLLCVGLPKVSAKYVEKSTQTNVLSAKDFYFTSPLLEGTTHTLMPGTTTLEIPVRNYADSLRYSGTDIVYTYTVTKDNSKVAGGSGTVAGGAANTASISVQNLTAGTYTVTVNATSPFTAGLTGTFVIPEITGGVSYKVDDSSGSPYAVLTVWTENYSGNVTVSWPSGLTPDSTDPALRSFTGGSTGGSTTVALDTYSSASYRFFKNDAAADYTTGQGLSAAAAQN